MKVVVLGAGVIGVSVADALAARGADVTVLDMRSAGRGASQAAAGMLAPYVEAHENPRLLTLGTRSLAMFDDVVAGLAEDTGDRIEYARTGTLEVALDAASLAELQAARTDRVEAGARIEWLDADGLRAFEPNVSGAAVAGLLTPAHGLIGVRSFLGALVKRAKFAGAVFETPVEAAVVESLSKGVRVGAGDRRYEADAVVLATGSWSRRVRIANARPIPTRPVRGQLLHLQWRDGAAPRRIVWGPRCYTVPWSDGSLLVGATVEDAGFDENATLGGLQALTSAALELFPGSATAHFEAVRVGLRPVLPDGLPAIGPLIGSPHIVVATGHYRNGVLLAPLTAEIVSRYVLDGVEDEAFMVTSPNRFRE